MAGQRIADRPVHLEPHRPAMAPAFKFHGQSPFAATLPQPREHSKNIFAEIAVLGQPINLRGLAFGKEHMALGSRLAAHHQLHKFATLEREIGDNAWLVMDLREGKNREIKRVLEHFSLHVTRLIRVSFGPFQLEDRLASLLRSAEERKHAPDAVPPPVPWD